MSGWQLTALVMRHIIHGLVNKPSTMGSTSEMLALVRPECCCVVRVTMMALLRAIERTFRHCRAGDIEAWCRGDACAAAAGGAGHGVGARRAVQSGADAVAPRRGAVGCRRGVCRRAVPCHGLRSYSGNAGICRHKRSAVESDHVGTGEWVARQPRQLLFKTQLLRKPHPSVNATT